MRNWIKGVALGGEDEIESNDIGEAEFTEFGDWWNFPVWGRGRLKSDLLLAWTMGIMKPFTTVNVQEEVGSLEGEGEKEWVWKGTCWVHAWMGIPVQTQVWTQKAFLD